MVLGLPLLIKVQ